MIAEELPLRVLVDSGVLRDLVFAEVLPQVRRNVLVRDDDVAVVGTYLQACRCRATTSQVAAELDRHLMKVCRRERLEMGRRLVFGMVRDAFAEAAPRWLDELDLDLVAAAGPVDAGLLDAARLQDLALLTADEPLRGRARHAGVRTVSVWEVTCHPAFRR
jgi:hypothetical protein